MSEQHPAPRVTATLPGGHTVEVHLRARRRDADGWWYEVSIDSVELPADAVRPIADEDYSQIPTTGADDTAAWVLQALRHDTPDQRALVLHRAGCWTAEGRLTPANTTEAKAFVRHVWATACDVCKPAP
ncbi:DUF6233 domain-containing protein [Streptomyces sp. NPDC102274]|uniref:DUF6233 domain-containing protein n=1 Tax=Streptomyces sp. NPDC102274 TaxID=3366151 RepID=UPI003813253F